MTATSDFVQALGNLLAEVYVVFGAGLSPFAFWGVHCCLLAVLVYIVVRRKKARAVRLACEVASGLLNPLLELVVLQEAFR